MKLAIFGANGKVGRNVVPYALGKGHKVRAFVHSSNPFKKHDQLEIIQGDIHSNEDVRRAVNGADAVISALGSWHTPKKDILSSGMNNIVPAMQTAGVKRIVSLTGNVAYDPNEEPSLLIRLSHLTAGLFIPSILKDGDSHINILSSSDLDWTVVRSPLMNEYGGHSYRLLTEPAIIRTIHRHAVAQSLVDLTNTNNFIRKSPFIVRP